MLAMEPLAVGAIVFAVGVLLGWALATAARRQDHRTFVLSRAPALPIRALAAHDDAWLRGTVHAIGAPLRCPWFEVDCVAFRYEREREHEVKKKDADGKERTTTEWRTEHSEDDAAAFELDDGARVVIALPEGENGAWSNLGHDYETSTLRHSAHVLEVGAVVSAFGVRRDDGTFGPLAAVPLLVTRQTRERAVRGSAGSENALLIASMLLPFAGLTVAAGIWRGAADVAGWLVAAAIGLAVLLPQWWLLTHNRLLRLRAQVRAAQSQIDIELSQRADLVPNLVATVRAAASHESDLLARLAAIRSNGDFAARVHGETAATAAAQGVLVLHERHPELRADPLYRDLHDRLWVIEEKLAHARGMYNDVVTEWNDRLERFPSNVVAAACRHRRAALFSDECDLQRAPRLSLS